MYLLKLLLLLFSSILFAISWIFIYFSVIPIVVMIRIINPMDISLLLKWILVFVMVIVNYIFYKFWWYSNLSPYWRDEILLSVEKLSKEN